MLQYLKSAGRTGISLICLFLISCASTPPNIQEFSDTADPGVEITALENNLDKARQEQVNMLSPTHFKRAEAALKKAKESRDDNDANSDILHEVAIGNAWLNEANNVAKTGAQAIPDIMDVRARALEAKADIHAKKALKKADKELLDIGEDFEDADFRISQKERAELLQKYIDIELSAIKAEKLGPAHANIEQAEKEGAKKAAPQTFALAKKRFNDAEAYITANRQNSSEIDQAAAVALAESERVLRITRESKINEHKTPEEIALEMEQERTSQEELTRQLASAETELGATATALTVMSAESSDLSNQIALDEKIKEVREQFNENEAEVLRDGDKLLIRLKGLKFPSGQADLTAASYSLMSKVQQTIKTLGNTSIEVEGHTDSTGPDDVNLRLSEERAASVKNYLVENGAVDSNQITSAGYADKKPISSNKTKNGRAQNRRVDVIISPL